MKPIIFVITSAVLVFIAQSCGKDEDDVTPVDPAVVARVQIGSEALEGHTYSWSPSDSLDNPMSARPMASPKKTTTYTLTATTKCGMATAKTTVRVFKRGEYGELIEVL